MSRGRDEAPSNLLPIKPSSRTCAQNSRPGTVRAPSCAETRAGACRGTDASARAACRPRGPRPRPRPRGRSSVAPHRASRPGVRLSRAPLPGRPRLHSVLSSSHLPAGRGPPARPRARVAFLPSFHRSRLARGSGLLLPSACPASPESRAVHWVTALRIHLSSVILWKMDTLLSRPRQHSLRDEGEQSVLPGTRRRDRGPLRDAAPDSPARTQGFVQTSRRGGCAAVAFPRVGPVGVTCPPSRCRYYDPLENRTKTRCGMSTWPRDKLTPVGSDTRRRSPPCLPGVAPTASAKDVRHPVSEASGCSARSQSRRSESTTSILSSHQSSQRRSRPMLPHHLGRSFPWLQGP